jgi:ketosteroid isomerase-like protein
MDNAPAMEALSPERREILETSEKWTEAIVANDAEAIGRFMSDDWIMVSNRGICSKQDFLTFVGSGQLTHDSMEMSELGRISVYGDMATMAARVINVAHFGGQTFHANEWTTDVFIKAHGQWRCVLTHITPVAEQKEA